MVGAVDGAVVGAAVGAVDGAIVGAPLGAVVGAAVGARLTKTPLTNTPPLPRNGYRSRMSGGPDHPKPPFSVSQRAPGGYLAEPALHTQSKSANGSKTPRRFPSQSNAPGVAVFAQYGFGVTPSALKCDGVKCAANAAFNGDPQASPHVRGSAHVVASGTVTPARSPSPELVSSPLAACHSVSVYEFTVLMPDVPPFKFMYTLWSKAAIVPLPSPVPTAGGKFRYMIDPSFTFTPSTL